MSTTSGPSVPPSTGKSSVLPSGSLRVAVLSAMVVILSGAGRARHGGGAQALHDTGELRVEVFAAPCHDVPEVVVGQIEKRVQGRNIRIIQCGDDALHNEIQLEAPPPALPLEPIPGEAVHHTERLTSNSLMWLMAFVGLRFFWHTSTQFMMVWQRNRRYGSSRLSRRSLVAWSRLSARKRYACSRPAGPTNLSGFHQNDGHEVEQHAHRMHS